jgi:hypothetical protein
LCLLVILRYERNRRSTRIHTHTPKASRRYTGRQTGIRSDRQAGIQTDRCAFPTDRQTYIHNRLIYSTRTSTGQTYTYTRQTDMVYTFSTFVQAVPYHHTPTSSWKKHIIKICKTKGKLRNGGSLFRSRFACLAIKLGNLLKADSRTERPEIDDVHLCNVSHLFAGVQYLY